MAESAPPKRTRASRSAPSTWIGPRDYARALWRRKDFTTYLALGNIRSINASTALGIFWWVLNPLANALIYYLVLGIIFGAGVGDPTYFPFLLSGIFVFFYTQDALIGSSSSIVNNSNMLLNLAFPRLTLVLSANLESAFGFLTSLVAYFALAIPLGVLPGPAVVALPAVLLIHTLFNVGLGALIARLTIPFRDMRNVLPHVLRIWLYLSPALYAMEQLPAIMRKGMIFNPMAPILELYRWALLRGEVTPGTWALASAWALVFGVYGIYVFVHSENTFARHL